MSRRRIYIPGKVKATFDSASTSPEAMRNWRGADNLSADAELEPAIRQLVVSRARYETANNGYLGGILQTLANDTIGTGPRIQIYQESGTRQTDKQRLMMARREVRWRKYSKAIHLAQKLRMARLSKARDGEVFIQKTVNNQLRGACKVDIVLYEAEQVGSDCLKNIDEYHSNGTPKEVDGIIFDRTGNPVKFRFWRVHPGSYNQVRLTNEFYYVSAENVIHYAHMLRPGQHRGFPEIAGTLRVFNDMRRYGNAVVGAAETAAAISFLMETDIMPDPEDYAFDDDELADDGKRLRPLKFTDVLPVAKNSGIALPEGWKGHQLKAEQPTSTYRDFTDAKLNESARLLSMPFNVAKGNSSGYNYASGRLDHQVYYRTIAIERTDIEDVILDNLFDTWESIDRLFYPEDYPEDLLTDHKWMWDGFEHCDPVKEANAQAIRLANGVTTLEDECAKDGKDYETVTRQRASEIQLAQKYGAPLPASLQTDNDNIGDKEEDE